jgi:glycosyltransferase involved in cell wall biosynthesis
MHALTNPTARPLVSFIIPARNEEKTIGVCLDSIRTLDCDTGLWECLLIDNGSADDTVEIAKAKGAKVFSLPNATISALRNFGASKSTGDFLAFVDADCVVDKDWLTNALPCFRDPTVACVGSHPGIPEECSWVQETWALQNRRTAPVEDVDWLPSMNILVRKSAFMEVEGFNESLTTCEDVDFCYRLKRQRYRIVSDARIKAIHYGEARTVLDFFKKERWRGQSNFQGILSHGFYCQEIPSLLLPVFYAVILAGLPVTMIYAFFRGAHVPFLLNAGFILLPPLIMSLRRSIEVHDFSRLARLAFLYLVYSLARTAAVFSKRQDNRYTTASQTSP